MPGELTIRVRYKKYTTPWFDYLIVSKKEMKRILEGTGWRVKRFVNSQGSVYIGVIEKNIEVKKPSIVGEKSLTGVQEREATLARERLSRSPPASYLPQPWEPME